MEQVRVCIFIYTLAPPHDQPREVKQSVTSSKQASPHLRQFWQVHLPHCSKVTQLTRCRIIPFNSLNAEPTYTSATSRALDSSPASAMASLEKSEARLCSSHCLPFNCFLSPSRTFPEHLVPRFVQDPHSSQAGCSIEILQSEAFESLYMSTNSHKPDPSSDLEI